MSVNVKINDSAIKKPIEVSKELEIINFRLLRETPEPYYLKNDFKSWVVDEFDKEDDKYRDIKSKRSKTLGEKSQFRCFQRAMKLLLAFGQCIALNPVTSILDKDISKIRFKFVSHTFVYTIIVAIAHTIAAACAIYIMIQSPVSIRTLSNMAFFSGNWCITVIFISVAMKWRNLIKEIFNCNLDEYVDMEVVKTVKRVFIGFIFISLVEQILSLLSKIVHVIECTNENDLFEGFIRFNFPWLFDLGVSYSMPLGIILQVIKILAVIKWNYTAAFIISMSLFLTSILNQINKKIIWAVDNNYLSSSIWAKLREDYTRATRLVRLFNDVFSGLILVAFAGDLFFICLQLFNFFINGILPKEVMKASCPNYPSGVIELYWNQQTVDVSMNEPARPGMYYHLTENRHNIPVFILLCFVWQAFPLLLTMAVTRPFRGYEYTVYLIYFLIFLFTRFLTVALVTANVNVVSLVPAPALYTLPSSAYTKEVQRFVDQIHGDSVALSGMEFFRITRHIILSAAGTLFTYELVLLQFNSDELNNV